MLVEILVIGFTPGLVILLGITGLIPTNAELAYQCRKLAKGKPRAK